jgi:outer membrane lipoprotein SlyB
MALRELKRYQSPIVFEGLAMAFMGGVAGFFGGGTRDVVLGTVFGAVVGIVVGITLVAMYSKPPE